MLRRRIIPTLLGIAIIVVLALLRLADPYPVKVARDTTFDFFQQLAPRPRTELPVRVVDIDEDSLKAIGQWPWPRNMLATLTSRLAELGAVAIGFDMLFPETDRMSPSRLAASLPAPNSGWAAAALPDYDQQFADALGKTPSILGFSVSYASKTLPLSPKSGFAVSGSDPTAAIPHLPGAVLPLERLGDAASGLGSLSLNNTDSATVVRQLPLVWASGKQFYPTLALEALRLAFGADTIVILGDTAGQGYVQSVRVGDLTVPTTAEGDLTLYYSKPNPSLYVSARDVMGSDYHDVAPLIAGDIVLVGTSASGLLDLHTTPLGDNVPGVAIHAEAIQQMLAGAYLTRADWVSGLEIASFVVIGLIIVFSILRVRPLLAAAIGIGLLAAMGGLSWVLFTRYGVLLDPSFPLFASFVLYSAMVFLRFAITDADRRQIRRAFGHYVAPAVLAEIERSRDRLKLGGEMRDLTVMFADMRDFTAVSETVAPEELLLLLNTLFGALGAEVTAQYGTIDKFIGDTLMAFWNAPVGVEGHALKACTAALGMRARLGKLNTEDAFGRRAVGRSDIAIGIGISSGPALVGNMGLETRFDYSCLGDTVNVAARVEAACKTIAYDIVVVEATRAAAPALAFLEAGSVVLKGKTARERIHVLVGDPMLARSPAFAALAEAHDAVVSALKGREPADAAIARCKGLAAPIDPRLVAFYDRLAERAEDFAIAAVAPVAIPAPAELQLRSAN